MSYRLVLLTCCLVFGLLGLYRLEHSGTSMETFSRATLKAGASGKDVNELQGRLRFLGFYSGDVTGQFDQETLNAVKWFQWKFGLKADGVVGGKTKLKLWKATKNWRPTAEDVPQAAGGAKAGGATAGGGTDRGQALPPSNDQGMTSRELKMMANAVYGESRGEPYEGQVAVAAVILNRVRSSQFPNTPTGVIFQPGAFTAVADGQIWLTPNPQAMRAVKDALSGWDPTDGCLYYFNPKTATSKWIWSRPQYKRIGEHIFCR
ncbi:spore cortex-lytic enzyme [Cohnella pontilimi]|uniref:Spore cortex-lytic enzyme n=1 Tax=Cohnella pontilimi TaxID=2564100 RepID=A0A4U0FEB1_9BACL|nr:spore cortex-lytic enzyme [Cohnella pontilimi]TJY43128.1 spore cortex-lytic enzyme [Cohnella pontilimi]